MTEKTTLILFIASLAILLICVALSYRTQKLLNKINDKLPEMNDNEEILKQKKPLQ